MSELSDMTSKDLKHLKALLEAKLRTLDIIDAMGKNPLPLEMMSVRLALESVKDEMKARG